LLWVDALSINQDDEAEKAVQVAMMGDIYHAAESVIIWLGHPDGLNPTLSQSILDKFVDIRSRTSLNEEYPTCKDCGWTLFENFYCKNTMHLDTARQVPKLRELVEAMEESKWFHRTWTYQELRLASSAMVHFGQFHLPSKSFVLAYRELSRSHGCVARPISKLAELDDHISIPLGSERLATLLSAIKNRQATQLHDKIFGVMGIPMQTLPTFMVDYGIDLNQLYMEVTRFCAQEDNTPGVLSSIDTSRNPRVRDKMVSLPSWAVDFSAENIQCGTDNLHFGPLPSLSDSGRSLNMYCLILGYYGTGDERYEPFHNSRAPDFRPLPDCFFNQSVMPKPPHIIVSQSDWIENRIGNIDSIGCLHEHYQHSSMVLCQLESHIGDKCNCLPGKARRDQSYYAKEAGLPQSPARGKIIELACILVNKNGQAHDNCIAVKPITHQTFEIAGHVNWPVSWPHGFYWIPELKQRIRGKTLYELSMAFTSVDLR